MRHDLIIPARPVKPQVILADIEDDLSDQWREATDPEAEYGEICTGLFTEGHGGFLDLIGLRVEGDGAPQYHDREHAIRFLGYEGVIAAERRLEERIADGVAQ